MRKIKDPLFLGLTVGFLANVPKTITCMTMNRMGLTTRMCSDLAAGIFLPKRKVLTKKGRLFGVISDFMTASFNGVGFLYILRSTGKVNKSTAIGKGVISGLLIYGLFRGVISKFGKGRVHPKDIISNVMMGVNSIIWGISAGLLTLLLGSKDTLEKADCSSNVPKSFTKLPAQKSNSTTPRYRNEKTSEYENYH